MGVPLHLIIDLFLILAVCSVTEQHSLRQTREAPALQLESTHNVTDINNRDLNKIVKANPKTENLDLKSKSVNNVNSFDDFPIKLGNSNGDIYDTTKRNDREKDEDSKPSTEKLREDNSRTIEFNSSKLWSSDFHDKHNVLTPKLSTLDNSFEVSALAASLEKISETTSSAATVLNSKFKDTIDSVDQELDNFEKDDDSEEEIDAVDENLSVEHLQIHHTENSRAKYEKIKGIVNNETVDKNIVHKDVSIEDIRTVQVDYVSSATEGDKDTTTNLTTARTLFPHSSRDGAVEKRNTPVLNNNIESEIVDPVKYISTTTPSNTILKYKGGANEIQIITSTSEGSQNPKTTETVREKSQSTTPKIATTSSLPVSIRRSFSDQDNIIAYVRSSTKSTSSEDTPTVTPSTNSIQSISSSSTTEASTVSNISEAEVTTDTTIVNTISYDTSTLYSSEEDTPSFIMENNTETFDTTTESITTSTIISSGEFTSENTVRAFTDTTDESTTVTEVILEASTKLVDENAQSTINNYLDSTTLSHEKSSEKLAEEGYAPSTRTTETVIPITQLPISENVTINDTTVAAPVTTEEIALAGGTEPKANATNIENRAINISTQATASTTRAPDPSTTTTEFKFVPIEDNGNMHTTLLPEPLNPNLNYSTSRSPDEEMSARNGPINNNAAEVTSSISTTLNNEDEPASIASTTDEIVESDLVYSKDDDGNYKGKVATIALSCVGAVCLILLVGLLYVMNKRQKRLNYGPRCRPVSLDDYSIDNLSVYNSVRRKGGVRQSKRSFGNPAFEDPVAPTHPLNFTALAKFSSNLEDIKAEYDDIPQITARNSELPDGCDTKNRYSNVIPLPETRVFLTPIDGYPNSDYINANYVTGPSNIKGYYIATQGPMQNTVDDFWRMVWEQHAKVILMLTHLVENGLKKCADYLPESEVIDCSRVFGDFQITLKKREVKEKYIISSLQLKNMVSNSWREVTHFWYLGWPEKGVPGEANSLIAFLIEARSYMKAVTIDNKNGLNGIHTATQNEHNPVVVHCSPGTGRTGVAIASDIAIREFETTRLVDIPNIVYRIRRDRANAIQTKEQYMFIYKVVSLYATKLTGGGIEHL